MGQVHMRLGEREGEYYILCDTRGRNLSSTRVVDAMHPSTCLRCLNRYNKIAAVAKSPEHFKELFKALFTLKVEKARQPNRTT
jgi:hypothetical protein